MSKFLMTLRDSKPSFRHLLRGSALGLAAAATMVGCSASDDAPSAPPFRLVGRYEAQSISAKTVFQTIHFSANGRYTALKARCALGACQEDGSYTLDAASGDLRLDPNGGTARHFKVEGVKLDPPPALTRTLDTTVTVETGSAEGEAEDPCATSDDEDDADVGVKPAALGNGLNQGLAVGSELSRSRGLHPRTETGGGSLTEGPEDLVKVTCVNLLKLNISQLFVMRPATGEGGNSDNGPPGGEPGGSPGGEPGGSPGGEPGGSPGGEPGGSPGGGGGSPGGGGGSPGGEPGGSAGGPGDVAGLPPGGEGAKTPSGDPSGDKMARKGAKAKPQCSAREAVVGSCAGASGVNCCPSGSKENGVLGKALPNVGCARTTDPNVLRCPVTVGSLLHDSCCGAHPGGNHCGGPTPEMCTPPANSGYLTPYQCCTGEWDHAVNDAGANRAWTMTFTVGRVAGSGWTAMTGSGVNADFAGTALGRDIDDGDPSRPGVNLRAPRGTKIFWKDTDLVCRSSHGDSHLGGFKTCQ